MNVKTGFICYGLLALLVAGWAGCGRTERGPVTTWCDLLDELAQPDRIARLDVPGSQLVSSFDPKGGNQDYNQPLRKGPEGWVVLADLQGPGYISRFWFTGGEEDGSHRVRFYFDGKKQPTLDMTVGEFCGGQAPFLPPLARYESYCWLNLYPIPFARRVVVMVQEGGTKPDGWPRLFFQINYSTLKDGARVETYDGNLTPERTARLEKVRAFWATASTQGRPAGGNVQAQILELAPGASAGLDVLPGPGLLRRLEIEPDFSTLPTAVDRERVLRDVVLSIHWDGAEFASVLAPLGDFFGSVWNRRQYQSLYFGLTGGTFVSKFPMPFGKSAAIRLENQGAFPLRAKVSAQVEPWHSFSNAWGYFHAAWSRSSPNEIGRPHPILRTEGEGKYVGCLLAVVSQDQSWWILEGDELMFVDGEVQPSWRGTGLEDYFNGGWYYQNVLARPLHGLPMKAHFRIQQYRLHLMDPVAFQKSFSMFFERGPDHASRGWMESMAYYYLKEPRPAPFGMGSAASREPPQDPTAEAAIMSDLFNYERFGDYEGARAYIDFYLEKYPSFPFAPVLRLRQIAYRERMEGIEKARPLYEHFIATETNEAALEQARLLLWFHEDPSHALVSLYTTAKSRVLLDGRDVLGAETPDKIRVAGVRLGPGRHALALNTLWSRYPNWIQAAVRTHGTNILTDTGWKLQFKPAGAWSSPEYDDSQWERVGGTGIKGPPEEPYVWVAPDAFVDMASLAVGLRIHDRQWPDQRGFFVLRKVFDLP